MKYLMVVLSGAADHPAEELGGKTPFEVAKIPNLQFLVKNGKAGQAKLMPSKFEAYPDVVLLNLLGYPADKVYTGRGQLEAANLELKLEDNEIPFRMNFITEAEGKMADPTAGELGVKEAKALINFLNKKVSSDFVRFFASSGYKNIAVIKDAHGYEALSARTACPHDILGEPIEQHLPKGPGGEALKKLMYDAKLLLQDHEINQVRLDLAENPANMIWLWGQGPKPKLEKFSQLHGCTGSLISVAEYAKGIARLTGLTAVDVKVQEKDLAIRYDQTAKVLLEELAAKDFVCLHLPECDEASRDGNLKEKISALESADYFILSKIKTYMEQSKDVRILVTPGHVHPWKTRRRVREAVPFVLTGKNIMADELDKFSETIGRASDLKVNQPKDLMSYLLAKGSN